MKRLLTLALVGVLSLGIASVSLAQDGAAGKAPAADAGAKAPKKHKKSGKKHKKSKKQEGSADQMK